MTRRQIIAGAPCAGKTTYILENAEVGDLIYDFDSLHQALSGAGPHVHLAAIRPYVLSARDAIFAQLEAHLQQPFLAITSSPKRTEVAALAERLAAEVVFLEVSLDEAHRRADLDSRPEVWHSYIDNWFTNSDFGPRGKGAAMSKALKKTFTAAMEFKGEDRPGEFEAVFATLNVIDLDVDVTETGAFIDGQEVVIEPWNHSWDLPAGKGVIHADAERAWVEGAFFLDTEAGRENYRTVKNLGPLAEWSYTFYILQSRSGEFEGQPVRFLSKLDTIGVSPVTRGAGIDTHTQSIKGQKGAIGPHETATSEAAWDGPGNVARARSGESASYYGRIFAWRDPDGDPAVKSTYKFPHHEVDGDGNPGAANVIGCQSAIGVLNGARGGSAIPDGDRNGVYRHLAAHLRDADVEPAELKSAPAGDEAGDNAEGETETGKPSGDLLAEISILEVELIMLGVEDG